MLSPLWSFLGRQKEGQIPEALRRSARRKFSRGSRGKLMVCATRAGFEMECRIGDPLDNLIYFDGEFEPELSLFLQRLGGPLPVMVDAGCNIGYVSCLFAQRFPGSRIISIDANPEMVRRCEANLRLNQRPAEVVFCALGEHAETREFHIPKDRPSYASFGNLAHDCATLEVSVRRLDDVLKEKGVTEVDLLKIDVEGFEPMVLGGLGSVAVKNILLEFSPLNLRNCGFRPEELFQLPLWQAYELFLLENETGQPLPFRLGPVENATEIVWARRR